MRLSLANSPDEYSTSEIDERNFWLSSWHRLVEDYSERRLTNDGDRLAAFFGLMTQMGTSLDSEVIAGLREPVLWYDLLWSALKRSDEHGEGEQRRASSIAPSWYWASAGRSIAYRDTKSPYRRLERMMNSWSIGISKDEVDSVEATLIVNSEVKVAWDTASNGWLFCATPKDGLVPTFSEDSFRCGYAVSQVEGSIVSQDGSLLEDRKWLAHWHPDDDSYRSMPLRFIWCIALARYHDYPSVSILCLVLEPLNVDGGVVKDFRRVGLTSLNKAGWEKDSLLFDGEKLLKVKNAPVNYAVRFSGLVTALRTGTREKSKIDRPLRLLNSRVTPTPNKCHGDQIPYLAILEPSKPHIGRGCQDSTSRVHKPLTLSSRLNDHSCFP